MPENSNAFHKRMLQIKKADNCLEHNILEYNMELNEIIKWEWFVKL